ncbi:type II toxin-antitoxin system VapC family toxin [Benzoatithermus flavus]|uniref:Ribonuclease VapC n=1 Tax=Benzoatithermus flavus TaxID=3108223 RepID=A0ABU8XUC9_9PROT
MILIDTHALIWLDRGDSSLGRKARTAAADALTNSRLRVSAIGYREVALFVAQGNLRVRLPVERWRTDPMQNGIRERMIDGALAIAAIQPDGLHKDPADRLIVATALSLDATLLTADEHILAWPGPPRRLDARL